MATRTYARRAAGVLFAGVLTVACVDLFHSTDFATLCDDTPSDPRCVDSSTGPTPPAMDSGIVSMRPHPNFCGWSRDTVFDVATKVCARLGACVGPLAVSEPPLGGGTEFGACVIAAQLAYDCTANPVLRPANGTDDFWSCVATATSCDDIRGCVYPKGIDICGNTGGSGLFTACGSDAGNANVQLQCDVSKFAASLAATPCVMNGQVCSRDGTSSSACTGTQGYACVNPMCTDATNASDCVQSGTLSIDHGVDCASMSATCAMQSGAPGCKPNAPSADACDDAGGPSAPSCVSGPDNAVQACVDHKLVTIKCGRLGASDGSTPGLPCDVTTAPPLYAIANACNDTAAPCQAADEGCIGGSLLSVCARGRPLKIDCATAGFDSCTPAMGLVNPAHCTSTQSTNPSFPAAGQ